MLFLCKATISNSDMFAWFYSIEKKIAKTHAYFLILSLYNQGQTYVKLCSLVRVVTLHFPSVLKQLTEMRFELKTLGSLWLYSSTVILKVYFLKQLYW